MSKTLKELKAENALEEQQKAEAAPQAEEAEVESEEVAEVVEEEAQDDAEVEAPESAETDVEAWQQTEEEGVEPKFTDSDIGTVKRKLRAKLEKKHDSETEALRAEIKALKKNVAPQAAPQAPTGKPKREDFYDANDPDEAYTDALVDWRLNNQAANQTKQAAEQEQQRLQQEQQRNITSKVDEHYTRAAELTKTSGISEDVYRQADQNVRRAVESVAPNMGDSITDALISKIGGDSEKVMYYLGRNQTKLLEFEKALRSDSSGIEAAMMLGEIKRDLTKPLKRKSNAPTPAPSLKGDESSAGKDSALLRKYKEAHKAKNTQKAFDIKREAKKAGVNTRNW